MKLKKAPPPVSDINVTPMVDVMLVVLIIFMVITPMLNKGANIELARRETPSRCPMPIKKTPIIVAITRTASFSQPGSRKGQSTNSRPKK